MEYSCRGGWGDIADVYRKAWHLCLPDVNNEWIIPSTNVSLLSSRIHLQSKISTLCTLPLKKAGNCQAGLRVDLFIQS